ncbi:MAG: Tim44/TimA family putative adaptor protein [Rhodobacteraceae bacterium]|nr:Tim44/TimA family putative adaptor protein [Paracoccaceae bacterium]
MGSSLLQLIALAAVAIFLIFRLRNTLGTRDGFENPNRTNPTVESFKAAETEAANEPVDRDIVKFVNADSDAAEALAGMKQADRGFLVSDFVEGAARAYKMILLSFAKGELDEIKDYISEEVYQSFEATVAERKTDGLNHVTNFLGLRESGIRSASLEGGSEAEITVEFVAELISFVTDENGDVVEGDEEAVRRQRDVWTFARNLDSSDPNWTLVATGE